VTECTIHIAGCIYLVRGDGYPSNIGMLLYAVCHGRRLGRQNDPFDPENKTFYGLRDLNAGVVENLLRKTNMMSLNWSESSVDYQYHLYRGENDKIRLKIIRPLSDQEEFDGDIEDMPQALNLMDCNVPRVKFFQE
jgi:hypothetical protein